MVRIDSDICFWKELPDQPIGPPSPEFRLLNWSPAFWFRAPLWQEHSQKCGIRGLSVSSMERPNGFAEAKTHTDRVFASAIVTTLRIAQWRRMPSFTSKGTACFRNLRISLRPVDVARRRSPSFGASLLLGSLCSCTLCMLSALPAPASFVLAYRSGVHDSSSCSARTVPRESHGFSADTDCPCLEHAVAAGGTRRECERGKEIRDLA